MDLTRVLTLARLQSKTMQAVSNQEPEEEMSEFPIN